MTLKSVGGVADTWTLLWHLYKAKLLNKWRAYNSYINSLIRVFWHSCKCYTDTFSVVTISNQNHENCKSCWDKNSTMQCDYGKFLRKWRVCYSNLIKVLWTLCTCPANMLTLIPVSNHYLLICRSCRDMSPILKSKAKFLSKSWVCNSSNNDGWTHLRKDGQ